MDPRFIEEKCSFSQEINALLHFRGDVSDILFRPYVGVCSWVLQPLID